MDAKLPVRRSADQLPAQKTQEPHRAKLTAQQQAAMSKAEREADIIQDAAFAASMASSISICDQVGAAGFKVYRDRLLEEAGNPTDPIERMMIEQLALAHHRIAQLHVQVEEAKSIEAAKAYAAAAARLTGEFRRLALAIRQYRQPISTKHFTVVRQQNVSSGHQQIAYLDQTGASEPQNRVPSLDADAKQGNKRITHAPAHAFDAESQTSSCRPQESEEARTVDRGRT